MMKRRGGTRSGPMVCVQALINFWGNVQGLQRITEDAYDGIQNSLDTLGLKEADLLR